jgi:hypothetical protein
MKHMRLLGISLIAVFAMSAVAAATTSKEELPELGRCVKPTGATNHRYTNAGCTTKSAGENTGKYEWEPGPGPKPRFASTNGVSELETVGKSKLICLGDTGNGEFTGPKTDRVTITFTSCELGTSGIKCQTAGAAEGEIRAPQLEGVLGFINEHSNPPSVGVNLKPLQGTLFVAFECSGVPVKVNGSVIAPVAPTGKMSTSSTLTFKATKGKQAVEEFEGGEKRTLQATAPGKESEPEQAGIKTTDASTTEEPLEIKPTS